MINKGNLDLNLTDDNNFYVSRTIVNDIKYRMNDKPSSVSNDELEIIKRVEQRKEICIKNNIHYFVLPDPSTSEGAYCHWCDLTVFEYVKNERSHNN